MPLMPDAADTDEMMGPIWLGSTSWSILTAEQFTPPQTFDALLSASHDKPKNGGRRYNLASLTPTAFSNGNNEIVEKVAPCFKVPGVAARGARRIARPREPRARNPITTSVLLTSLMRRSTSRRCRPLEIAPLVDDAEKQIVTRIGEWGPGSRGSWLSLGGEQGGPALRDLGRVRSAIAECRAGTITIDYQPGHPDGF